MSHKHDKLRETNKNRAVFRTNIRPNWMDDLVSVWVRGDTDESLRAAFQRYFDEPLDSQASIAIYANPEAGMTYKLLPKGRVVGMGKLGHQIFRRK